MKTWHLTWFRVHLILLNKAMSMKSVFHHWMRMNYHADKVDAD